MIAPPPRLFDDRRKAAVRLDYDGRAKKWLLTVYEDKPLTSERSTNVPGTLVTEGGETPSPDRGSDPLSRQHTAMLIPSRTLRHSRATCRRTGPTSTGRP
jgi:hypothetical protein